MLHKLSMGAKVVTLPKFEKNTFLNAIKMQKSSILHLAPPLGKSIVITFLFLLVK